MIGSARRGPLANIALNTVISFQPSVDWVGHVAGLYGGLGLGPLLLFPDSFVRRPPNNPEPTFDRLGPIRRSPMSVSFQDPMDLPKARSSIGLEAGSSRFFPIGRWSLTMALAARCSIPPAIVETRCAMRASGFWSKISSEFSCDSKVRRTRPRRDSQRSKGRRSTLQNGQGQFGGGPAGGGPSEKKNRRGGDPAVNAGDSSPNTMPRRRDVSAASPVMPESSLAKIGRSRDRP